MNLRIWILLTAVVMCSCTTPHKTFKPPNNAKVTASTKKVREGITKAHDTAAAAKKDVIDAQASGDKIIVESGNIDEKLDQIIKAAPPELQPALAEIKADIRDLLIEEAVLNGFLTNAHSKQDDLEKHLTTLDVDVDQLKVDENDYYVDAQGLANEATTERNERIKVEKQLIQQKIFGLLWKVGGVLVVVVIAGLVILWWSGKLALKLST